MTKTAVESGHSISELARAMGVAGPTIRNWLKAAGVEEAPDREQTDLLVAGLADLQAVYRRMNKMTPAPKERRQNTLRLGKMVLALIQNGAHVETLASTAGVSQITVKTWLKSIHTKPDLDELAQANEMPEDRASQAKAEISSELETFVAPLSTKAPSERNTSVEMSIPDAPIEKTPSAEFSQAESSTDQSPGSLAPELSNCRQSQTDHWIRIRVAGHIMEVNWADLLPRLSKAETAQIRHQVFSPVDGEDFNTLAKEDCDLQLLIDKYERIIIKSALTRHKSIGATADALGVARSTFDAKRRKHGLI